MPCFRLDQIAEHIGARLDGDPAAEVCGLASLSRASAGEISHLSGAAYRDQLATTQATAVILAASDAAACPAASLIVDNPYLAHARVSHWFQPTPHREEGIHPTAHVAPEADIADGVCVGPHAVVGPHTSVGPGACIGAHVVIGAHCVIGAEVNIMAHVTIYDRVAVGNRTEVHSGAVIGAAGFGFTPDEQGAWQSIAQLGGVDIGADVSIGANTCIDCGAIEATVIEDGVKIDNQVQIGHNSRIGAHTLLCGQVAIAGSTTIGRHCVLGGRAGVGGDLPVTLCDGVIVSSTSVISQSVTQPGTYSSGAMFHEHSKWRRNALRFLSLDELFKRVKRLENKHNSNLS